MRLRFLNAAYWALMVIGTSTAAEESRCQLFLVKATHTELEKIELEANPLLTDADITNYDWKTHAMTLTKRAMTKIPKPQQIGVRGLGFVIVADGKRLYRGSFWTSASSIICPTPMILADKDGSGNVLHILRAYPSDRFAEGPDPRDDIHLLKVLSELGKLAKPLSGHK